MKLCKYIMIPLATLALVGCEDQAARDAEKSARELEDKATPTFMFFNHRAEIVSDDYHVPDMKSEAAGVHLQNRMKTIPGHVASEYDLERNILTVKYKSSTVRKMNFEEAIALAGFSVNHRPANPRAKIPQGVK